MLELLAATSNKHKIVEFQQMFDHAGLDVKVVSPETLPNFPPVQENGSTFAENSALKAVQMSRFADMAAFADDSGLVVDALGGAPGIFSSRYAGENASDEKRIQKLLLEMKGKTDRTARFVCVISLAYRGKLVASFQGTVEGCISDCPHGNDGFGYDPVFIPDGYDKTFAELGSEIKNELSHRAKAFAQFSEFTRQELSKFDELVFV